MGGKSHYHHQHHSHHKQKDKEASAKTSTKPSKNKSWHPPNHGNPAVDQICITDVTSNLLTVTITECRTWHGFFRDRDKPHHDPHHPSQPPSSSFPSCSSSSSSSSRVEHDDSPIAAASSVKSGNSESVIENTEENTS